MDINKFSIFSERINEKMRQNQNFQEGKVHIIMQKIWNIKCQKTDNCKPFEAVFYSLY